tara:strand:+ start:2142 stop:3149 length:1008 start_codon:yes stop_codon:yes gene_type:complete
MPQVNNKYSVTIIGLGNIGLLYDLEKSKSSKEFLTHTRSAFYHENFEIKFLIDSDPDKLLLAKNKYGNKINYLTNISEEYSPTDIIVLASLPSVNSFFLNKFKEDRLVKFFLIEKPFLNKSEKLSNYKDIIHKTYVNYFRKSLPFYKNLKIDIDNFKFGNIVGVNIFYSKGLSNNGSHLIDLMNFLFDSSYNLESINIINYKNDYSIKDESVTFSVEYTYKTKSFSTIFHALDESKFSLAEVDLIFEKNRLRMFDFGGKIEVYEVQSDKVFSGYKNLIPIEIIDSDIDSYGIHTYNKIYNMLEENELNYSTLEDESNIYTLKKHINNKLKEFKNE